MQQDIPEQHHDNAGDHRQPGQRKPGFAGIVATGSVKRSRPAMGSSISAPMTRLQAVTTMGSCFRQDSAHGHGVDTQLNTAPRIQKSPVRMRRISGPPSQGRRISRTPPRPGTTPMILARGGRLFLSRLSRKKNPHGRQGIQQGRVAGNRVLQPFDKAILVNGHHQETEPAQMAPFPAN
jgi:hypothetical protein